MSDAMPWRLGHKFDPAGAALADRHYSRRPSSVGAPQFMPPGRTCVLVTPEADAVFGVSWPFSEFVRHAWPGAWVNCLFRSEAQGRVRSSDLISAAVAATRWYWPDVPALGMVTFIDPKKVRHKRDLGRCYLRAGFRRLPVQTQGGHVVLQMLPEDSPNRCRRWACSSAS